MARRLSPTRVLVTIAASILIAESFVISLFIFIPFLRMRYNVFLDTFMSICILSPTLYFFLFRPMVIEIEERKRVEAALEANERFLTNVFSSIQDGISILDKNMNIIRVNHTMEKWYAHSAPLVGKKCYDAYHGRKDMCEICPTYRTVQSGEAAHDIVPKIGPGGQNLGWVDVYSFPLVDPDTNKLTGVIEYVRDVTDKRQAEEAILRRDYQLEVLSRTSVHINAVLEVPIILRTLVASAMELVGSEAGTAGLYQNGKMVFKEYNREGKIMSIDYSFSKGEGISGWIIETMKPYYTNDAEHDPHVSPGFQKLFGFHNLAIVPIISRKGVLLGCFEMYNKLDNHPFDVLDMFMLHGLAASAAVALENAEILSGSGKKQV
jgi:PAS domain S-box-containing protein